ncbi:site-specific DNA-methyltransferase [Desemzia incerta]|uniref:site-specific DNA-methyltransferase n=1 Tax=Desemzia incerta TaxID=82801 RepID=UPI003D04FD0D
MFNKMSGTTPDLTESNIEKLKQLFPEIITDGKIDFEKLEILLGKEIDDTPERYNFTWHGKKETMQFAQQPSKGTLRPMKEKSKQWDTTGNLYIEGDNLEVLKLLQRSYYNKVKMIYIDPPYNTGKDFVYKDNFTESIESYLELTGQIDNNGNKFMSNSESTGRYHTDWLNMMYSRLKLARSILVDDGVIFISIDDNEVENLIKIANEIFGENNFIDIFSWKKTETPANLSSLTKKSIEYIIAYRKSNKVEKLNGLKKESKSSNGLMNQSNSEHELLFPPHIVDTGIENGIIKKGKYGTSKYNIFLLEDTEVMNNKFIKPVKLFGKFKWGQKNLEKEIAEGTKISIRTIALSPSYEREEYEAEKPWNFIDRSFGVGTNEGASSDLEKLIGHNIFDYPKPSSLIKYLINSCCTGNDIILDFFSGSATTAHATMELNAEDGGNRKFIMVQLPELLEEKSVAYKEGYRTICDIGEERIRRAGEKAKKDLIEKNNKEGMLSETQINPEQLDIGFKVFSLDTSNLREWQAEFDNIEVNIDLLESNFIEGRSEDDVLYEIILKNGLDLTYPIKEITNEGFKIYDVAFGNLFVCLNDIINRNVAHKIATLREEYGIETSQVVFKDSGFENDTEKLNCYEILKAAGYQEADLLSI